MGNIPLPALSVQPPQNALEEYARVAQIGSQVQEQQARAQEMQLRQQQIADQQATTKAMNEWDPKSQSYDDLSSLVLKHGGSANAATGMQLHGLDVKTKAAALSKDQLDNFHKQMETVGNDMLGLSDPNTTKDEDLQSTALDHVMKYRQNGWLGDKEANQLIAEIHNAPDTASLRSGIAAFGKQHMGAAAVAAQAKTAAETEEAKQKGIQAGQEAKKAETETKIKNLELSFGGPPDVQESRYQATLKALQKGEKVDPDQLAAAMAYESAKQTSHQTSDSLGVISTQHGGPTALHDLVNKTPHQVASTPTTGSTQTAQPKVDPNAYSPAGVGTGGKYSDIGKSPEQAIDKLTPAEIKNHIVDLVGTYHMDPMLLSRMLFHHPEVVALIHAKYPDWDETTYNAKNDLIKKYTSGPQSRELNAISTAMGHAKIADDAIDGLHNNDLVALNRIGNYLGVNVAGQTAPAAFKTIIHRLGPELTNAYVPGGGGQGERITNENDFNENLPPQTLHNNLAVSVKMLRSKAGALENQYKQAVGRDDFATRFLSPEARASFDKFEKAGTQTPPESKKTNFFVDDPRGKRHYFNDQESMNAFKAEAKIK